MANSSNNFSSNALGRKRKDEGTHQLNGPLVKRPRELMPPVAGKVLKIELENFMCHNNLKLEFDVESNNCFYIIGPNGSGKSALFAGLNIGLGGTGRTNERGRTIQHYIKEGQKYARIRIDLTNEGPNACPSYDKVIIVERNITEKASQFTLKTSNGDHRERIVSRKKTDLDSLIEQLNIELDNPLAWLSQDRSRQFLQQMKPDKLYQLYRKTTEMDSTDLIFQNIDSHFDEFCKLLSSLDKEKKAREETYLQMHSRFKAAGEIREKKKERQRLLWYQLWAPIRDNNDKMNEIRGKMDEVAQNKAKVSSEKERLQNDGSELRQQQQDSIQKKEHILDKNRQHNEELSRLKKQSLMLNLEIGDDERQVHVKERRKAGLDKELQAANEKLERLIGDSTRNIGEEKQSLDKQIAEVAQKIESIDQNKAAISVEHQQTAREHRDHRKLFQDQSAELTQLERRKSRLEEEKLIVEKSKTNRLNLFGKDIPRLVDLIKSNEHLFGKVPIGPIGSYIKLKDLKWANAVECLIKKLFGTFICDSQKDRMAFDELCRIKQIKTPDIITTAFTNRRFDIRGKEPPMEFLTIERILEELEPTIYNILIDMTFVESILLIESDDEARNIMYPSPPPNVQMAVTLSCSQVHPRRGRQPYRFFANNGQFHSRVLAQQRFLAQDGSAFVMEIRQLEQEINQKEHENLKLKAVVERIGAKASKLNESLTELERQLNVLRKKRFTIEEELRQLDQVMLSGEMIENCQKSLHEVRQQQENCIRQLDGSRAQYAERVARQKELQRAIEQGQRKAAYLKNDVNQIESEIENDGNKMRKIENELEKLAIVFDKLNGISRRCESDLQDLQAANEQRENEIKEGGVMIPEGETLPPDFEKIPQTRELDRNLKELVRYIKTEENNQDPIPTKEDLEKKKEDYKKFRDGQKVWTERKLRLEEMRDCRKRRFALLKLALPRKIERFFKEYMNIRGYRASLDVKDDKGVIEIRVETHQRHEAGETEDGEPEQRPNSRGRGSDTNHSTSRKTEKRVLQDLRGLSGGERSFTTISFVMALWSCMESPFRCSDEFDVFMDPVNRRIAMEMLGEMAKDNKHIQFFFFTPQGIKELKDDELQIEVFELKRIAGIFDGQQENEEPRG